MITIEINKIIAFYDEQDKAISNHVSSITGLIGEDLGAGLLKHYFDSINRDCTIINDSPTEGSKKGKWLDRWLKVKNVDSENHVFYQTEIKNWSSHSIGGKKIELNASEQDLRTYANARFSEQWNVTDTTLKHDYVAKVLKPMKKHNLITPSDTIKPLICFWYPISNETDNGNIEALFEVSCNSPTFKKVTFFSMSLYLRKLNKEGNTSIKIEAPNIERRVDLINGLLTSANSVQAP